jgi:hypothetical protein
MRLGSLSHCHACLLGFEYENGNPLQTQNVQNDIPNQQWKSTHQDNLFFGFQRHDAIGLRMKRMNGNYCKNKCAFGEGLSKGACQHVEIFWGVLCVALRAIFYTLAFSWFRTEW